jgi:TonB family protein
VISQVPIARRPVQPERRQTLSTLVEVVVGYDGKVIQVSPLRSTEGFDETVAEAISQWVFEPTQLNGKPVMVITEVPVSR